MYPSHCLISYVPPVVSPTKLTCDDFSNYSRFKDNALETTSRQDDPSTRVTSSTKKKKYVGHMSVLFLNYRVSWAPDHLLCAVKLFHSDDRERKNAYSTQYIFLGFTAENDEFAFFLCHSKSF
jgi:hypothetical protein